jgi:N-acyl-D-aspartate/D-glutamate deacylase
MYDLVLKGGRIYDGSGMPSFTSAFPPIRIPAT